MFKLGTVSKSLYNILGPSSTLFLSSSPCLRPSPAQCQSSSPCSKFCTVSKIGTASTFGSVPLIFYMGRIPSRAPQCRAYQLPGCRPSIAQHECYTQPRTHVLSPPATVATNRHHGGQLKPWCPYTFPFSSHSLTRNKWSRKKKNIYTIMDFSDTNPIVESSESFIISVVSLATWFFLFIVVIILQTHLRIIQSIAWLLKRVLFHYRLHHCKNPVTTFKFHCMSFFVHLFFAESISSGWRGYLLCLQFLWITNT